ncbi:MAG TPA: hypothetical protein VFY36_06680 [Solirubrobacteraceae bacterium]|nr:hypothetical protein [Solirubrobacteraceae bacterium]
MSEEAKSSSPNGAEEQEEIDAAASEAARIGGIAGDEDLDPRERAVIEGGGGVAEGFEQSEALLIEHASHGDQQSAHAILHDRGRSEPENRTREDGEADQESSSKIDETV